MKWNIIVGTLVLGLGLSTQSFGFDLLDRMLGAGGCGCEPKCCDTGKAGCASKSDPCEKRCRTPLLSRKRCCSDPCAKANDCSAKKSDCGCSAKKSDCGCSAKKSSSCGCDDPCASKCKSRKRRCLLDALFSCRKKRCCDNDHAKKKSSCGCGGTVIMDGKGGNAKSVEGDMAPMPPAPVVDPSAFLPRQRRVINVSSIR